MFQSRIVRFPTISCFVIEVDSSLLKTARIGVKLVCGSDLLDSFCIPGVWALKDVRVLSHFIHNMSYLLFVQIDRRYLLQWHSLLRA